MDYFARIEENRSYELSNSYSEKYETYNCISNVLDKIESQNKGLYPVEVWYEVLRLEKLLLSTRRRDKFIGEQRTRLENKYRKIVSNSNKQVIERTKAEAERSVMCVLLALAMHLEACPDDKPNPHQEIIKSIYKIVVDYDADMAYEIANAYNEGEDEENEKGYFVQPHDPLFEEEKCVLPKELQENAEYVNLIFDFYASTLKNEDKCINSIYSDDDFFAIWDDLGNEETIIRQMYVSSSKIKITLKSDLPNSDKVIQNNYNLKLVLNIIGLMRPDIVTFSIDKLNELFFTDTKQKYFKDQEIRKWGSNNSGIADEAMYDKICSIIKKHKKTG